jgi:muramoyltetrapeptide carboxypeptidase
MINRREFVRFGALAAVAAGAKPSGSPSTPTPSRRIKPKRLSPGDRVGLVLPASAAFEANEITLAKEQLEVLGLKVEMGKHVFEKYGYFAGPDRDRAEDINDMFRRKDVAGIFCYTGGWGSPRVLPDLDWDAIAENPKVFIGYSDITGLLNPIHQTTGLVTFHGPVAASDFNPYTLANFKKVVMSPDPIGVLANPPKKPDDLVNRQFQIVRIAGGRASGPIVGGNLTLVATLMGTPWEVATDGALLFLEDIHEELYRVDRMLTQLALGGKFDHVAGVVFGYCTECPVTGPSFSLGEILSDRLGKLGVPVISGLAFGHLDQKLTLPIGLTAALDADEGTLVIPEAAVV